MSDRRVITRRRGPTAATVAGAAALLILLSACGGTAKALTQGGGSGSPPAPSGRTDQVNIANFAFGPASITVASGTTVTWTNEDTIGHTVFAPLGGLTSPVLNQGQSYSHTFSTSGTFHYICSIHPFMHGTVVVTPA